MKSLVLLAALALTAHAQENSENEDPRSLAECSVRTMYEHTVATGSCFRDEVMTGIQPGTPLMIRCAKLRVTCPSADRQTAENPSHN